MNTMHLLIAGFGGQGVLFAGKFIAYMGMIEGREVSWLPSYGPEMRGGTANCSVILSDTPVGSPIVAEPDCLVAMNLPSFQKYQNSVRPGGVILYDSTLIAETPARADIRAFAIPATQLAGEAELEGFSNMVLMGKFLKECVGASRELIEAALKKTVPAKKADLTDLNRRALALGQEYEG